MKNVFKTNDALLDVIVGILAFGALVELVSVWFVTDKLYYSIGLIAGCVTAAFMAWHMAYSIEKAVNFDESNAVKRIQSSSVIRYGVALCVLCLLACLKTDSLISGFVGIMGLKVSAYLAPFTHKLIRR